MRDTEMTAKCDNLNDFTVLTNVKVKEKEKTLSAFTNTKLR